jgi:hypothetical protein
MVLFILLKEYESEYQRTSVISPRSHDSCAAGISIHICVTGSTMDVFPARPIELLF